MKLQDFLGKKLTDIGHNIEKDSLVLTFSGGHELHVKRDNIARHIAVIPKAKEDLEEEKEVAVPAKKAPVTRKTTPRTKTTKTKTPAKPRAARTTKK